MFKKVVLRNFRLYRDREVEFSAGTNIIVGANASGKTTILEALYMLCRGKTYRGEDSDVISHGEVASKIEATLENGSERSMSLMVEHGRTIKKFQFDGVTSLRMLQKQALPVVLFEPNDLRLLHGEPSLRRDFIDTLAVAIDPHLQTTINHYKRSLAQRNALLKQGGRSRQDLFVWNLRLSELGEQIAHRRLGLIASMNEQLTTRYDDIAGDKSILEMRYISKFDEYSYATQLLKKLESDTDLDIARGFTGNGPHREDWQLLLNGSPSEATASRGETRTVVLALKLIELKLIEAAKRQKPILLLDDVFGELDISRREALAHLLTTQQIIITTTEFDFDEEFPAAKINTIFTL